MREGERSWNQNTKEKKQLDSKDLGRSKLHSSKSGIFGMKLGKKKQKECKVHSLRVWGGG